MYALCKLSYLHKLLRFHEFSFSLVLLHSKFEHDTALMSNIIFFVCLNVVSVGVMFSLGVGLP